MKTLRLNPIDNVRVVIESKGSVPRGHKVAANAIPKGQPVIKFGHIIGFATQAIGEGEHVHVHNIEISQEGFGAASVSKEAGSRKKGWSHDFLPSQFEGYLRSNGSVGVRNYLVIVSSVNCSATVAKAIARHFEGKDLGNIDGIIPITHTQGCAQEIGGEAYQLLNRTLAGWIFHPNVVGALIVGLGCEGTTFKSIVASHEVSDQSFNSPLPLEHLGIQETGGTAETIRKGILAVESLMQQLPAFQRSTQPVSKLKLALNCGGSDSFSSITANPILGLTSDALCSMGGSAVLAEIPECLGTEALLYSRVRDIQVSEKLQKIFGWWDRYAKRQGVSLNDNLAPGNIAGGISTILEKSLGSVTKAGTSPLNEVLDYAEPITSPGFVLMNTPGYDPVSVTGLVAGGCQMVAFTTGRGSVYGAAIAPTVKIATTSELFARMTGDLDFDAGRALSGSEPADLARELMALILKVANGEKTCSETLGIGKEEFIPWNLGETL